MEKIYDALKTIAWVSIIPLFIASLIFGVATYFVLSEGELFSSVLALIIFLTLFGTFLSSILLIMSSRTKSLKLLNISLILRIIGVIMLMKFLVLFFIMGLESVYIGDFFIPDQN